VEIAVERYTTTAPTSYKESRQLLHYIANVPSSEGKKHPKAKILPSSIAQRFITSVLKFAEEVKPTTPEEGQGDLRTAVTKLHALIEYQRKSSQYQGLQN
jgi:hypothetical protein